MNTDPAPARQSFQERERIINELERQLQNCSIEARVCEIVNEKTAIVSGATYADFLFARSILARSGGWRVVKPGER